MKMLFSDYYRVVSGTMTLLGKLKKKLRLDLIILLCHKAFFILTFFAEIALM